MRSNMEKKQKNPRSTEPNSDPKAFERESTTDPDDRAADRPKGMPMHTRILIGLGVGLVTGIAANLILGGDHPRVIWLISNITEPIGTLFLRLLLMIVIPLVFSSLVVGVAGVGDVRKLGRIGLTLANTIRPGKRIDPTTATALQQRYGSAATSTVDAARRAGAAPESPLMQVVRTVVPSNPVYALASENQNMLHLMFFALMIGIAITLIPAATAAPLMRGLEAIYEVTAKLITLIMRVAPYAVACLIFSNIARFGVDLLQALFWFMVTVLLGLALQMFGVYSLSLYFLSRISPLEFFRRIETVIVTAFSTSSSNATLPTAIRVSEENLGIPSSINRFVLTVGATANQNGTALYEGVTVLFLAQLAGVDLSFGQQLMVVYLAILGGVGTAGVPAGSIPFIVAVLVTVNVNPLLIAIILGVDRILDMCRTTLNVVGDITIATYVARSEGYKLLQPQTSQTDNELA